MQTRLSKKMPWKSGVLLAISAATSSCLLADNAKNVLFENRYSTVQVGAELSQTDLLESIIEVNVAQQFTTVGECLELLLAPHGYQLEQTPMANEHFLLLMLPLPESHRHLGPMTLREAIDVLGGEGFEPLINPVTRTLSYQLQEEFHQFVSIEDTERAREGWFARTQLSSPSVLAEICTQENEGSQYGPVQAGETLSGVAGQFQFSGLTMDQVLVLLFRANPTAFTNANMNHLSKGVMLDVPQFENGDVISPIEASRIVDEHHRYWVQAEQLQ